MQNAVNRDETPPISAPEPARSRGRPRAFDRVRALDLAMRLFWRKGYAATAISDLTHAMGIGTTSLYAAFGSKEALFAEAFRHYGEGHDDLVWAGFRSAATTRGAVEALLVDSATVLTRPVGDEGPLGCMLTLSNVGCEGPPDLGSLVQDARDRVFERVRARLARGQQEGELPATLDVEVFARFILTLQNGMSLQARQGVARAQLEAAARLSLGGWDAWTASDPIRATTAE